MSINSEYADVGFAGFARTGVKLALAFGQSNVAEGVNTNFDELTMTDAATEMLYAVSILATPTSSWGEIRGTAGGTGRFGALVQFMLSRWQKGEVNWSGLSHSRSGYSLADDWLPGTTLETVHLRDIMDRFGEILGYANSHVTPIHIDTLYYYQGESDMSVAADADNWKANFYQLLARFNAYGLTWDKMVLVKPNFVGYGARAGYATVVAAIDEITAERLDTTMLDASSAQLDGAGAETVTNHHNSIGQSTMGEAWSAAHG
jgi:hypothetical protein